jgi:hypothetical protein
MRQEKRMRVSFTRPPVWTALAVFALVCAAPHRRARAESPAAAPYKAKVQPLLAKYCYDCHGEGVKKGKVSLDEFASEEAMLHDRELWWKVLKNVRAGVMPPPKEQRPSDAEKAELERWVKFGVFGLDPANPDPGRVTLRRLNRVEYRNTIRDLMGVDFRADEEFPPDDTGYGFDNIGEVLTVSPLLLEKYMEAAEKIVSEAVPTQGKVVREVIIPGSKLRKDDDGDGMPDGPRKNPDDQDDDPKPGRGDFRNLSFYKPAKIAYAHKVDTAGDYKVTLELNVRGEFDFDPGRCKFTFKLDDKQMMSQEFSWQNGKTFKFDYDVTWEPGERRFAFELEPLEKPEKRKGGVDMRVASIKLTGPTAPEHFVRPKNFERFFSKDVPTDAGERKQYAREILARFTRKAYRRPADARTLDRLVAIAEQGYQQPGKNFEQGVSAAMVAVLASPRFVFRQEEPEAPLAKTVGTGGGASPGAPYPFVDEHALASRLSYFLWSSMPDDELSGLADRGELRKNLPAQVKRMVADDRAKQFVTNFVGQWLQVRDVDGISIDERSVFARDSGEDRQLQKEQEERRALFAKLEALPEAERQKEFEKIRSQFRRRGRFQPPKVELNGGLRTAMRRESEMLFEHVLKEDKSVLDFVDSDYAFLNEKLAKLYGIDGVKGDEMRRVELPKDSPRGGVLTQAAVLVVTSNPTRTSPVKRGLFVLDNILGTPTPPPPADIPALEESEKGVTDHEPTTREILAIHRGKPLCASCHNRMDPLGLALESFNALGIWRDSERKQPLEVAGTLITGESFTGIRELKKILRNERKGDFYRCLTEKALTYALGRGLDYYDVDSVDRIVARLAGEEGRFSALVMGVVESAPFQKTRLPSPPDAEPAQQANAVHQGERTPEHE